MNVMLASRGVKVISSGRAVPPRLSLSRRPGLLGSEPERVPLGRQASRVGSCGDLDDVRKGKELT